MELRFKLTRKRVGLVAALAALITATGVAYAAIPDAGGNIYACKLNATGTIRLIDKSLASTSLLSKCTGYETEVSWNKGAKGDPGQQGPPGERGPEGQQGPAGADGEDGADGVNGQDGRSCVNPDGTLAAPACQGPQGGQGVQGPQGPTGPAGPSGAGITHWEKVTTQSANDTTSPKFLVLTCPAGTTIVGVGWFPGGSIPDFAVRQSRPLSQNTWTITASVSGGGFWQLNSEATCVK